MSNLSTLTRFVLAVLQSTRKTRRAMESSTITGLVAAFIGIAIMLGVSIQILGNASTAMDCIALNGTGNSANSTSWQGVCLDAEAASENAFALLIVILIVVAAVAILFVVRML